MNGNKVVLKYRAESPFGAIVEELRNVTEIHFNYPSAVGQRIAFESSIHSTGKNVRVSHIQEFETSVEDEIAESF